MDSHTPRPESLLGALRDTLLLDPTELSTTSSHEPLYENRSLAWKPDRRSKFFQQTRSGRLVAYLRKVGYAIRLLGMRLPSVRAGEAAAFTFSTNQRLAIAPVTQALQERGVDASLYEAVGLGPELFRGAAIPEANAAALEARGVLLSLLFLPCLVARMLTTRGYRGRSYSWALDEYWSAYGVYLAARLWLPRRRPAAVLLSNDHMLVPSALDRASRDVGIPSFYLQHACVTERFPPLRFSYALLDGQDASDKYSASGESDTTVFLVGMPRFDAYAHLRNESTQLSRLGVCLSKADHWDRIESLLKGLAAAGLGIEVSVRPHPGSARPTLEAVEQLAAQLGMGYSGSDEKSFEFIARHDAIVAGVSAIMVEAALLNVTPLQYELCPGNTDWYGFIPNGLCESFGDLDDLIGRLGELAINRPTCDDRVGIYCATAGTPDQGRSSQLAAQLIERAIQEHSPADSATSPPRQVESGGRLA